MKSEKIKKHSLLIISILATVLIVWQNSDNKIVPIASNTEKEEPDFFIVNGKYTVFDADGDVSSIMKSREAKHYPDQNIALLERPNLLVFREDNTTLRLTADNGKYKMTEENLELINNVTMIRDEQLKAPWTLKTESLTVLNKSRFITTKQPVTISDNVSILEGEGMNAWVDDKKIEITSNVRGNYAQ